VREAGLTSRLQRCLRVSLTLLPVAALVTLRPGLGLQSSSSTSVVPPPPPIVTVPLVVLQVCLGLSADQISKLKDIQQHYHSNLESVTENYLSNPSNRDADEARSRELTQQAGASMQAVLSDQQRQQLPTVLKGVSSLRMLNLPSQAAAELQLTDQQTAELASITEQMRQNLLSLPPDQRLATPGFQVIKDADEQAETILSPAQKAVVEKYNPRPDSADPASVHCADLGGKPVLRKKSDGTVYGICVFPNGHECEEHALLRGDCSPDAK
jgi:putative hemolysin